MHLVTLQLPGRRAAGAILGKEILDFGACAAAVRSAQLLPGSVRGIIEGGDEALSLARRLLEGVGESDSLAEQLRDEGALMPSDEAQLLAPIPDPGFILSCGMNYHEHLKEMKSPVPATPAAFYKANSAIVGPGAPIVLPRSHPNMVDWEGEFSVVIGHPCFDVKEDEALDYVAGYTLVNDVSARDWVAPVFQSTGIMGPIMAWEHNILGKQFPTFCPMGPSVATRDEIKDPYDVQLRTTVNGKVMQSTKTDDLVFNVQQLIAYYSKFYMFRPGDIITTGSPSGVGYGRDPKVFLRPGDIVEVYGEGIGTLSNPVVAAG